MDGIMNDVEYMKATLLAIKREAYNIDTEIEDDSGWHNFVVANSKWQLW